MPGPVGVDTKPIVSRETAEEKRQVLRAKYRSTLEARLGKTLDQWYSILRIFSARGRKTQFELSHYLQTRYGLELWEANVVTYYYQNPEKRFEIGGSRAPAHEPPALDEAAD